MPPSDLSRAIAEERWEIVQCFAKGFPDMVSTWSKRDGFFDGKVAAKVLPLHEALTTTGNVPVEVIMALVEQYPDSVFKTESSYDRLPLHCACRKNADPRVISYLVAKNKQACLAADAFGRVPLHYALTNGADLAVIKILLKAHPRAARGEDVDGWTPVHVAMGVGASKEVVKLLLDANPEAVLIKTRRGSDIKTCIPPTCPHREVLRNLANETTNNVVSTVKLPSLRRNTTDPDNMFMT